MMRKASAADSWSLEWFKSSYSSNGNEATCVEVATTPGTVHVRDSKNIDGPFLALTPHSWSSFVAYASQR
ncbi:DUF397 domain-containing protein [Streptomyces sp. NPDC101145]|uniref:DUF397 domain-containing protein n=1 Tax=Streptomyces sp. NPDC101145 TaxID=3366112 RepID=UPI003814C84E